MAGILDIMASDISVVGQSDFIATTPGAIDIAVNNVAGNGLNFSNAAGDTYFQLGDNILIRKVYAVVNWGFAQGSLAHIIGLAFWNGVALETMSPFSNSTLSMNIPTLCDPLDFGEGIYVPMPIIGVRRQIRLTNIYLHISQINLPALLNAVRVKVQYFMEILHTLPIKTTP